MRTHLLILLYIGLLNISPVTVSEQVYTGDYKMIVNITNYDFNQGIATADVQINVNLPSGTGFVYIPLPFPRTANEVFIIEPTSSNNLVLFGNIRPAERYSLIQIALNPTESNLTFSVQNAHFALKETAMTESNKAVVILLNEAYNDFGKVINDYIAPQLSSVTINGANIQNTEPPSRNTGVQHSYTIGFSKDNSTPPNVTIFLMQKQNQLLIYIALAIMGIIIGLFTAPRVVSTKTKALWTLALSIIGLVILAVFIFILLTPEQRLNDTITVTAGTISGLLFGFILEAIRYLYLNR